MTGTQTRIILRLSTFISFTPKLGKFIFKSILFSFLYFIKVYLDLEYLKNSLSTTGTLNSVFSVQKFSFRFIGERGGPVTVEEGGGVAQLLANEGSIQGRLRVAAGVDQGGA